jgi:hypothetical protein
MILIGGGFFYARRSGIQMKSLSPFQGKLEREVAKLEELNK